MELFERMKEAHTIDYEEPITKAIGELPKHRTCLVVLKGKNYAGIIDDWTITSSAAEHTAKVGSVAVHAPVITRRTSLLNICKLFSSGPYRALPVVEEDKLIGVLPRSEVLKIMVEEGLLERRKVEEVMDKQVPKIEAKAHLGKAKARMQGNQYGKLAVVEEGKLVGVLTAYDFTAFLSKPKDKLPFRREKVRLEDVEVKSIMKEDVYTIKPDASLRESANEMIEGDVAALIVESAGKPVGIISARHLLSSVVQPEEVKLEISGLDEKDRIFSEDVKEECKRFINKLKRSCEVEGMWVHFKKYGKKYSTHGGVKLRRRNYSASSFGWSLRDSLKSFLDELERMVKKGKEERVARRREMRKSGRWVE
ncbi:MAG: CBS domain-containing protein [Candidatus Micrarchaeia archaeon]